MFVWLSSISCFMLCLVIFFERICCILILCVCVLEMHINEQIWVHIATVRMRRLEENEDDEDFPVKK